MPVGVPKVCFLIPGDEEPSWVDINRLYRQRGLFLFSDLDSEMSNQLIGLIVFLSIDDYTQDLYLFISSPGGGIIPGVALYDVMQIVLPYVHTIGMGVVASMASFVLTGGEITNRIALPNARVMIHQPTGMFSEDPSEDYAGETMEMLRMRFRVTATYAQRTGKSFWIVAVDMERDTFMSALEAHIYGIVDNVGI
uniref:ATP-dependent Clp protease proteolytic subunit n=1 Tax=Alniphyllum pterospermum TaxID=1609849 RepID=A0A481P5R4_9ERIC|nr:clpP-like protease [Alniphyllum pterospermum]QAV57945.1 clpP-like protease [Alniphyllum pterospermum]